MRAWSASPFPGKQTNKPLASPASNLNAVQEPMEDEFLDLVSIGLAVCTVAQGDLSAGHDRMAAPGPDPSHDQACHITRVVRCVLRPKRQQGLASIEAIA